MRIAAAPVAQLDSASASEAEGCGFEPRRAYFRNSFDANKFDPPATCRATLLQLDSLYTVQEMEGFACHARDQRDPITSITSPVKQSSGSMVGTSKVAVVRQFAHGEGPDHWWDHREMIRRLRREGEKTTGRKTDHNNTFAHRTFVCSDSHIMTSR